MTDGHYKMQHGTRIGMKASGCRHLWKSLGKWLFYYLYSRRGQKEIFAREKGIAFAEKRGQTHLYPRDVLTIPVPLPSIARQIELDSYLDGVYQHGNGLKTTRVAKLQKLVFQDRPPRHEVIIP